jgi:hypothetical protein
VQKTLSYAAAIIFAAAILGILPAGCKKNDRNLIETGHPAG